MLQDSRYAALLQSSAAAARLMSSSFIFFFFLPFLQDYTGRLYDCDFNQQLATQMLLKNSSNHTQVQLLRK